MGQLADMMPSDPTEKDVLDRILWLVRELIPSETVVIFFHQNGRLVPLLFRGPYSEELRNAKLGINEPLVSRAFESGEIQVSKLAAEKHFFHSESVGLACPIKGFGALYVGRWENRSFTEQELQSCIVLCQYANLALQNARLYAANLAPRLHEASLRLSLAQQMLASFSAITEAVTELMTIKEPEALLERAGQKIPCLAQVQHWAVFVQHSDVERIFFHSGGSLDIDVVFRISQDAIRSGNSLSLLNMDRSSYGRPTPSTKACHLPLLFGDGQAIGCLFLATDRPHFTLQEQQIADTFALNVGSYYWTLRLHQNLKESQAQLVQSSKMAAVGQLAAGVAHELNTPLGAIKLAITGALKAIVKLEKPERAIPRLERSVTSVEQMQEIISRLLHYSGKRTSASLTDINEVVRNSLSLVGHQLSMDKIEVHTQLEEQLPLVELNTNEIQQVLINLLTNARDAVNSSGKKQKTISIRTTIKNGFIQLSLADNGTGIKQVVRESIFEPFVTTKEVGKGTGLGLSISKEILDQHGGTMEIESKIGTGTTFFLRFATNSNSREA